MLKSFLHVLSITLCIFMSGLSCQVNKTSKVQSASFDLRRDWVTGWSNKLLFSRDKNDYLILECTEAISTSGLLPGERYVPCKKGTMIKMPFQTFQDGLIEIQVGPWKNRIKSLEEQAKSPFEEVRTNVRSDLLGSRAALKEEQSCVADFIKMIKDNKAIEHFKSHSLSESYKCDYAHLAWESLLMLKKDGEYIVSSLK